ncbi:MAG: putative LPS assembly protein LptD [Cytophagales bacterium]|nr:putative LPS assembly protein LptD [Cytophagales bacterium]
MNISVLRSQNKKNTIKDINTVSGISATDTLKADTSALRKDTVKKDRPVETTIKYTAEDSIILDAQYRTAKLYRKSQIDYGNKSISAHTIDMDYNKNLVNAKYGTDSTGKKIEIPSMKDGSENFEAYEIKYNYKTKRGQVKDVVTKQGEGVIHGEVVKKEPDHTMYIAHSEYTTCNLRHPHYSFKATRIKMVPKKKIVSGPFNMQIDDIPTLIAFPFAIFPLPKRRGSGIIMPAPAFDNGDRGFSLQNGGYFWAMNEYANVKMSGTIYTLGSYNYTLGSDYVRKYRFSGNLSFLQSNNIFQADNPTLRRENKDYKLNWTHRTLRKNTGTFSANVNIATSQVNQLNEFQTIPNRNIAQSQSDVSYNNNIRGTPFAYATNVRVSQNLQTKVTNTNFPSGNLSMSSVYPLRKINGVNNVPAFKQLKFSYATNFNNNNTNILNNVKPNYRVYGIDSSSVTIDKLTNTYQNDSLAKYKRDSINYFRNDTLSFERFLRNYFTNSRWTMTHSIPINTSVKVLKYFNASPNFTYSETWYDRSYDYTNVDAGGNVNNNATLVKVDTISTSQKFARQYQYNGGVSLNTQIYGTVFIRRANIEAIRHTINPTVSYTYTPDFSDQFAVENIRIRDNITNTSQNFATFNRFTGAQITNNYKVRQTVSFSINNTFQLKVRDTKDTTKIKFKKVDLLKNLSLNGSYDIMSDSGKLSNIAIAANTNILQKISVQFNADLDPYYYDYKGLSASGHELFHKRLTQYAWDGAELATRNTEAMSKGYNMQGIGRITRFSLNVGTSIKPKGKSRKIQVVGDGTDRQFLYSLYPSYIDWSLPWNLSINYSLTYNRYMTEGILLKERSQYVNNVQLSGDITITPKWKFAITTAVNIDANKKVEISTTNISIARDLHCWDLKISWFAAPYTREMFTVTLGIKSATLKDIKLERKGNINAY